MLGHRASSQTVCSLSSRSLDLMSTYLSPPGTALFSQSGFLTFSCERTHHICASRSILQVVRTSPIKREAQTEYHNTGWSQKELASPSNAVQGQSIRQGRSPRVLRENLVMQGLHRMGSLARNSAQDRRCEASRIVDQSVYCGTRPAYNNIMHSPSASLVRRVSRGGTADSCTLAVAAVLAWLCEIRRAYCRAC